jgi:hypothetical protein
VRSRRSCIGSSVDSQQVNLEQVGACSVFDSVGYRWTADHAQDADLVEDSSISSSLHSHSSGGISTQVGDFLLVFLYIDTDIYMQGFVVLTSLVLYFSSVTSLFFLALYLRSFLSKSWISSPILF